MPRENVSMKTYLDSHPRIELLFNTTQGLHVNFTQVEQALDHVRLEFINQLDSVKWLDQATRAQLKDKAQAVSLMVGYPDWILEVDKLDHRYEKVGWGRARGVAGFLEFIEKKPSFVEFEYNILPCSHHFSSYKKHGHVLIKVQQLG